MREIYEIPGRKRIIVVSLFSGMDLFMLGFLKAGMLPGYACEWNFSACRTHMYQEKFRHPDGTPVMEPFIVITREEYDALRSNDDTKDTVGLVDGQFVRTKWIQEVNGRDIRAAIEARYGKDIIIVAVGGPPCQALTSLSARGRKGLKQVDTKQKNSRQLIFDFLRVVGELAEGGNNVLACMEQVPELGEKQYKEIYDEFIEKAKALPFNFTSQDVCSLHYGGNQSRWRKVIQFSHHSFNIQPTFPEADTINAKRVKDFLPHVDHFFSGHFVDTIKNKNHFMCTVTKGSPAWLESKGQKWSPTEDELLLCFDVKKGEYLFPPDVSKDQRRQAIANAVCLSVSNALANNMIDNILGLKHIGEGYFIPKDADNNPEGSEVDLTPDEPQPTDGGNDGETTDSVTEEEIPSEDQPVEISKPEADTVSTGLVEEPPATSKLGAKPLPPLRNVTKAINDVRKDDPSKIISSERLFEMQFDSLNFEAEWNELFGLPSVDFHCIIHGMSGTGKSTLAVQFAKYLADNFGKVLYVSGEEGFSKTFKDKFVNNDARSDLLDVSKVSSYDEFIRVVPRDSYNFIFLDSLDTMKIDAVKLRTIKELYKNTAIITISQATKAGQMRGSYEIVHDSDIAVEVVDGMATTTKNRFKKRGMTFNVFQQMNGAEKDATQSGEKKINKPLSKEARLDILTKKLKDAVDEENYELAAKLRDKITQVENNSH